MIAARTSFGFICTEESTTAVQRRPEPDEQVVIDDYRETYEATFGYAAWGLHYVPFPDVAAHVCIWLPKPESLFPLEQPAVRE